MIRPLTVPLNAKRLRSMLGATTDACDDLEHELERQIEAQSDGELKDMLICMHAVVRGANATLGLGADRILFDIEAEASA